MLCPYTFLARQRYFGNPSQTSFEQNREMTFDRRQTSKHQGAGSSQFIFLLSTSDKKDFAWNHCKESRLASSFFSYHWFLSDTPMAVRISCPFYLALPHSRRGVVLHAWNFAPKSSIQNISGTKRCSLPKTVSRMSPLQKTWFVLNICVVEHLGLNIRVVTSTLVLWANRTSQNNFARILHRNRLFFCT